MSNNNSKGETTPLKIKGTGFYSKQLTLSGDFLKWLLSITSGFAQHKCIHNP